MKITATSDWRQAIPFETSLLVSEIVPGEPTRCFSCGLDSDPRPRTELWAFKHRHKINHDGFVRFYCAEHLPVVVRAEPTPVRAASSRAPRPRATGERTTAPRRPSTVDAKPRAMCTDCFVEVSATGICGMCGKAA